jgi:Bacterial SH3 domain
MYGIGNVRRFSLAFAALGALLATGVALANTLDVPIMEEGGDGQMANCASSMVTGLRAGGDGFLAVRSGPGSQYRKLDELRNGETVVIFQMRGEWAGVVYRTENVRCSSKTTRPVAYGNKGWVHKRWLKDVAG